MQPCALVGVLLATLIVIPVSGLAQTPERQTEQIGRDLSTTREAEDAAQRARERRGFEGPTIGFQDILRDPDNLELNLRFVRGQIRDGELRGAASTLERVLALQPDLVDARYLHAIVLLRLDATQEAERELRILERLDLSPERRAEVAQHLRLLERRRQRIKWTATLSIGGQLDTNRDSAPANKQRLILDTPVAVRGGKGDAATLAIGQLRMTYDLGTPDGHEFFAVATSYRNWQRRLHQFELFANTLEAGFLLRTDIADISPSLIVGYANLRNQRFQRTAGGRLRAERQLSESVQAFGEILAQYQHFSPVTRTHEGTEIAPRAFELSGLRADAEFGLVFNLSPEHRLSASYTRTRKAAQRDENAYDGDLLALRHTWLLGNGSFLLATLSGEQDLYDGPDLVISNRTRRDRILRGQLGIGTPLGNFLPQALAETFGDITLLALAEGSRARSNLKNYSTDNLRGQLLLTKLWEF